MALDKCCFVSSFDTVSLKHCKCTSLRLLVTQYVLLVVVESVRNRREHGAHSKVASGGTGTELIVRPYCAYAQSDLLAHGTLQYHGQDTDSRVRQRTTQTVTMIVIGVTNLVHAHRISINDGADFLSLPLDAVSNTM